jgi:hypothetical protein
MADIITFATDRRRDDSFQLKEELGDESYTTYVEELSGTPLFVDELIQENINDFLLTPDKKRLVMASDADSVSQEIESELQLIKGELDDQNRGVDYYGIIFSDAPLALKVQEFTRVIKTNPYVKDVITTNIIPDKTDEKLKFEFVVQSVFGELKILKGI